jgi:hypothetical protein
MNRRFALLASGSPGMNSRSSRNWSGGCLTVTPGAYSSVTAAVRRRTSSGSRPVTAILGQAYTYVLPDSVFSASSWMRRTAAIWRSIAGGASCPCSTVMWAYWARILSACRFITRPTARGSRTSKVTDHSTPKPRWSVAWIQGLSPARSWDPVMSVMVSTAACAAAPSAARVTWTVCPNGSAAQAKSSV